MKFYLMFSLLAFSVSGAVSGEGHHSSGRLPVEASSQRERIIDEDTGSGLTFEQDKPRYAQFASNLRKNRMTKGYVITYGGRTGPIGEAKTRAECIKKYLIKKHRIAPKRIVTIDGGYREKVAVDLFLVLPNEPPPTPVPTVNPHDVKALRKKRERCTWR